MPNHCVSLSRLIRRDIADPIEQHTDAVVRPTTSLAGIWAMPVYDVPDCACNATLNAFFSTRECFSAILSRGIRG